MRALALLATILASLAVLAAAGVAAFAVYSWKWKAEEKTGPDEALLAQTYAGELSSRFDAPIVSLKPITEGLWRLRLFFEEADRCYALHLDDFKGLFASEKFEGVGPLNC